MRRSILNATCRGKIVELGFRLTLAAVIWLHFNPAQAAPPWVVVCAAGFEQSLAPLVEHRRQEGFDVHVIIAAPGATAGNIAVMSERDRQKITALFDEQPDPSFLLLVGTPLVSRDTLPQTILGTILGTEGRMRGEPSDQVLNLAGSDGVPRVAVGRFPCTTVEECRAAVKKTLEFETRPWPAAKRRTLSLIVGHPGGGSLIERNLAAWFLENLGQVKLKNLGPAWSGGVIFHSPDSPYYVENDWLSPACQELLLPGYEFACYLGHSNWKGCWSEGVEFLKSRDWSQMKGSFPQGVFFTCGCYACQIAPDDLRGFGHSAFLQPDGPVAVIGPHGESYGGLGQLALEGLVACMSGPDAPDRLGEYWLGVQRRIAQGEMDGLTFFLFDQADGSRGKTSLADQRREHLQMWMLLGDPALKLPANPRTIELSGEKSPGEQDTYVIKGRLTGNARVDRVRLTLERPLGTLPLVTLPTDGAEAGRQRPANRTAAPQGRDASKARWRKANQFVLKAADVAVDKDGRFQWKVTAKTDFGWSALHVRAVAESDASASFGVARISLTAD